jgi:ATP-binding cassette subfamily B multidrug efflux pump
MGNVQDGINTRVKPFGLNDKTNAPPLKTHKCEIALNNVTFAYPGRPVFDNLSLTIPAGQKIGLVGPSGAGKSTLVQLLLRLHDIQGGAIKIDGQDIAEVTQNSLRNNIAVIPQSSDLLHRSIRENITYGNLNATEDDMISAAKRAHAHEFILSLHDHDGRRGYDAMVGERGVKLSGGQRQRVAIARAILKDAPILLLDEATSALDSESERLIQESLTDLMAGRTVIAIAHRLSTIARLDRLIVMDEGRVVESGTHQQLLTAKGLYAHLWSLQSGGFLGDGHH